MVRAVALLVPPPEDVAWDDTLPQASTSLPEQEDEPSVVAVELFVPVPEDVA